MKTLKWDYRLPDVKTYLSQWIDIVGIKYASLKKEKVMNYILGDKVRVLGQEYDEGFYDVIVDITTDKYVIEDGCTYKKCELEIYEYVK